MKKRVLAMILVAAAVLSLCGCGSIFEDEYYFEEPYTGENQQDMIEGAEISNMSMLKAAIIGMISSGQEQSSFRLSSYKGSLQEDVAVACYEIETANPLAVYAVSDISAVTNRIVSYYVVDITITYKKTLEDIQNVVNTSTASEFGRKLSEAVQNYESGIVLKIYSTGVNENYIRELVKNAYYSDPVTVVTEPKVSIAAYPQEGANRIYEIELDFGDGVSKLNRMSTELRAEVETVSAAFNEQEEALLLLDAVRYLDENCGETEDEAANTAYSALILGDANAQGMALALKALCGQLGIECQVVQGSLGSMGEKSHYWNIVCLDGEYYHVDSSRFGEDPARTFLMSDSELWGQYVWDAETYPACGGELSYHDFVEPPAEEAEEPVETPPAQPTPELTPQPTETPAPEDPKEDENEENIENN